MSNACIPAVVPPVGLPPPVFEPAEGPPWAWPPFLRAWALKELLCTAHRNLWWSLGPPPPLTSVGSASQGISILCRSTFTPWLLLLWCCFCKYSAAAGFDNIRRLGAMSPWLLVLVPPCWLWWTSSLEIRSSSASFWLSAAASEWEACGRAEKKRIAVISNASGLWRIRIVQPVGWWWPPPACIMSCW